MPVLQSSGSGVQDKTSACLIAELKTQFERDGYIVLKNVFLPERVQALRTFLTDLFENRRLNQLNHNKTLKRYPYQDVITDVFLQYPDLLDLVCAKPVIEALSAILGENYALTPETSILRDVYTTLHTDTTTCEMKGFTFHKEPDFLMVTLSVYLQDNDPELGGGLFIVPGSHKKPDRYVTIRKSKLNEKQASFKKLRRFLRKLSGDTWFNYDRLLMHHAQGHDIPSKAGDVVIFNSKCYHRASFAQDSNYPGDGGKLAFYGMMMRHNRHVQNHIDFLKSRTDTPAYDYLHQPRDTEAMADICKAHGFTAL